MQRIQLLEALEFVFKGVTAKELFEQSASFVFSDGRIYSYNDEISMSYPIVDCDITGAVKGEEFYKLITRLSKNEIEVEEEGNVLKVTCGRAKAGLSFQAEIKLPFESVQYSGNWTALSPDFLEAVQFASVACSDDMSRAVLTCVRISEDGVVEASDGLRIISHKITGDWNFGDVLIPSSALQTLYKYSSEVKEVAISNNWIHFKTGEDAIFSARTFCGTRFPDISKHLEVVGSRIEFPKEVLTIIARAAIFATSSQKDMLVFPEVVLDIKGRRLKITSQSDIGWFEEVVAVRYEGEDLKFAVHPDIFQDVVAKMTSCTLGENSILFEGKNWKYVVAMQVKKPLDEKGN